MELRRESYRASLRLSTETTLRVNKLGNSPIEALAVFEEMRQRSTTMLEEHQLKIGGSAASCTPWAAWSLRFSATA